MSKRNGRAVASAVCGCGFDRRKWLIAGVAAVTPLFCASGRARGALLLDDSFTDGVRTNTNLPNDSAMYVGVNSTDGGSLSVSSGKLANVMGTSSRRNWDFFTSDNSTPDNSTAHNSVLQLGVGDTLKWSMSFTLPNGATSNAGNASRDFRIGIYTDPTDARVQTDTNSDSGGATNPWGDALGYGMKIPLNGNLSNTTSLFQIGKRTSSASTTLFGSDSSYTYAPVGGAAQGLSANTSYTAEMVLNEVSATDMKITANFYQGTTLLSTQTVDDLGSSVGGTANIAGSFAAASSIYTKFDQLAFRMSSNTTTSEIDFTNWKVDYTAAVPEPTMIGVICLAGYAMLARRPRRERA